jgi:hypothetical protein
MSMASVTSTRERVLLEEGVIKAFSNCNGWSGCYCADEESVNGIYTAVKQRAGEPSSTIQERVNATHAIQLR